MFRMDVPPGPDGHPVLPEALWRPLDPAVQAVLGALVQQVVALTARVRELEARLGQHSSHASRPPSSDPPQAPRRPAAPSTGRRRGAQPGHVAHLRAVVPPERVDHVAPHWPAQCAHCQAVLPPPMAGVAGEDCVAHQVTERPPVRAVVTEHRRYRVTCPACGYATRATLPPDVPAGAFGPRLQATVATLSGTYRLSRRQVADLCGTVLDAPLAVGSVDRLCQATSAALAAPVADVPATLPQAPVANADETRWPQAGHIQWRWVVVPGLVTVLTIAASRSSQVIKDLLGTDYTGVLGSDRYVGYAWLDVAWRQVCWAHLKRDFQGTFSMMRGRCSADCGRPSHGGHGWRPRRAVVVGCTAGHAGGS